MDLEIFKAIIMERFQNSMNINGIALADGIRVLDEIAADLRKENAVDWMPEMNSEAPAIPPTLQNLQMIECPTCQSGNILSSWASRQDTQRWEWRHIQKMKCVTCNHEWELEA